MLAHNASLAVANARLVKRLRSAEERLRKENQFLKGREESRRTGGRGDSEQQIIGQAAAMRALAEQLAKVVAIREATSDEIEQAASSRGRRASAKSSSPPRCTTGRAAATSCS